MKKLALKYTLNECIPMPLALSLRLRSIEGILRPFKIDKSPLILEGNTQIFAIFDKKF